MPSAADAVKAYFQAMEKGSHEEMVKLFSKYAVVDSPLYGKMQASEWAKDFFADTAKAKVTILNLFVNGNKPGAIAAHYNCQWILRNSQFTNFEGFDVFSVSPEGKIDKLSRVYDSAKVRDAWDKGKK